MIPEAGVWAVFLLPLAAFLLISLVLRPFFKERPQASAYVTVLAIGGSLALSSWTLYSSIEGADLEFGFHPWLTVGALDIRLGLMVDHLTAVMLVVVTGVSLMVQVYSMGYMKGDPGYQRYFALMCLFTASMVGLVVAGNIVQLYVFWELVGVCSYLLIGFWYDRPAAAAAAKKAFLVTRIGDVGFLLAILYLFFNASTFDAAGLNPLEIADIHQGIGMGLLGSMAVTWLAVGIFAGAAGKSAQFPLHVWLPDAMEGPTPVSSLIHAATMVAAGVFLVARFFPVFQAAPDAMSAVAVVGAFTAIFSATMGLASNDIKRVMAYSTVSQLGYMMAALGVGAYGAAIFHLFNHAFFKCLLFMGAGSVNHAAGTFDMRYMGGLRRVMPWTYAATVIGALSLAGIFPLSGFWSKDEILLHAWRGHGTVDAVVFWLLIAAVFLTAVYAFRMIYMTFHGQFRGGVDKERQDQAGDAPAGASSGVHLADSPPSMLGPMMLLALAAVVSGYLANPLGLADGFLGIKSHWFNYFVVAPGAAGEALPKFSFPLASVSVGVAAAGIVVATLLYLRPGISLEGLGRPFRLARQVLTQRYYMDHLFEGQVTSRLFYGVVAGALDWFDRWIVDNVAEFTGWFSRNIGRAIGLLQTGQVQGYAVVTSVGVAVIVGAFLIWG